MNCNSCGANLPPGVQTCPRCGAPTPYNAASPGSPSQYDPTVLAAPSGPYSGAGPAQYAPPPDNYTYGSPVPSPQTQYGAPPPPPPQYQYAPPPQPGGFGAPPQQPKRRSRVGLIVGLVLLVVALLCVGAIVAAVEIGKSAANNATATPTTPPGQSPSGNSIDSTAAANLSNLEMASAVDSNTAQPTTLSNTFTVGQTIYASFHISSSAPSGFAESKWYVDGTLAKTSSPLAIIQDRYGYFSETYKVAAQGAVELYWCTQSNCSDEALAGYQTFTVTSSGYHSVSQSPLALLIGPYAYRPD